MLRRLLQGLLVLWGVTLIVFVVIHMVPGDPARSVLGPRASDEAIEKLNHELGLDQSIPEQYVAYLGDLVTGDLGQSIGKHTSVSSLIGPRLVPSFALVAYAIGLALLAAVPLALLSAVRANRPIDHGLRLLSVVLYAIPSFWFGLMLALVFGQKLGIFPTSGYDESFPGGWLETLTLPAVTIALFALPQMMRVLRASTIETLDAEFVEAAHARGLGNRRVLTRHVLRNSLMSTVTLVAVLIGVFLSFSVVVEKVFAVPGMGSLLVESVFARDYPTIQAVTFIFALTVVLANLAADLTHAVLDPRVRL